MFDRLSNALSSFREGVDESVADEAPEAADDEGAPGLGERAKSFARGRVILDEDDVAGALDELERALLAGDVAVDAAEEIVASVKADLVGESLAITKSPGTVAADAVRESLVEVMAVGQFDIDERLASMDRPGTILFTGVNGVGKTTTIAKVARYLRERDYSVVLANGDTYRAGATEQLAEHAEALGLRVIEHERGGDPAAVIYDAKEYASANDVDFVLADTAGRLHTSDDLMSQLDKIDRVVDPALTLFVDEAVAGQDAIRRAKEFNEAAQIDGIVLTKADADTSGGAAISVAKVTGKPVLFLGTGQGYDDLERFNPDTIAERLLG